MRIVHVITRMILGGAQENTLLSCAEQAARGHQVTLLSGPTVGPEGTLVPRVRATPGLAFEEIPDLVRHPSPWHDSRADALLRRRLAALAPDVVHTHSAKAGILGRHAAAAACPQAAIVHTIHGLPFYTGQNVFVRLIYTLLERRAARVTDRFISVCDAMTDEAVAAGIAGREKFTTVYSGMDVETFVRAAGSPESVRRELDLPSGATVALKLARLFHLKGQSDVLRALAAIRERHPTLYVVFAGDGVLRKRLQRQARRLGVHDRVRFTGLVPPERVPVLMHAADFLVHASLREGLARVLPQAMLSGRPAISYDIGGAREVVHTGETGTLVAAGDWRGLARAMDAMAGDRRMRQRLGERGRALCLERFDYRKMVDGILAVYEQTRAGSGKTQ
jgi:glycosyltransferase involved in cell wall biosynthesis